MLFIRKPPYAAASIMKFIFSPNKKPHARLAARLATKPRELFEAGNINFLGKFCIF